MCDVLQGVTQAVGVVICGVDAPVVSRVVVGDKFDPIRYWVQLPIFHYHFHSEGSLNGNGNGNGSENNQGLRNNHSTYISYCKS